MNILSCDSRSEVLARVLGASVSVLVDDSWERGGKMSHSGGGGKARTVLACCQAVDPKSQSSKHMCWLSTHYYL